MKALCKQTMGFILMILLACGVTSIKAQDSADDEFITVSGVVKDKQTRKKLEYVNTVSYTHLTLPTILRV